MKGSCVIVMKDIESSCVSKGFQFLVDSGDINETNNVRRLTEEDEEEGECHEERIQLKSEIINDQSESQLPDCGGNSQGALPLDLRRISRAGPHPWRKFSFSSSTPPSSVDLEWEHEGGAAGSQRRLMTSTMEDASGPGTGTGTEGSPVDSLEWDSCEDKASTACIGLDPDTELLLQEIERLTAKALIETGREWADR
ncbi:uncharacterized protein LOC111055923 [Nilaparvata lugens]|uniref:uncharacterized protein LOC111055923 n=1 Tax=Nilaparvata lugens TaxID=108931 RepID=UPI00193DAA42|nr:uncharacterized protein LOC111055923 [Nilaparvata lugens]